VDEERQTRIVNGHCMQQLTAGRQEELLALVMRQLTEGR
jgi:hypothetical protein